MMRSRWTGAVLGILLTAVLLSTGVVWIGCGGGGGGGGPTPPPAAPSNVTANPGDNQVTLNWSAVSGATSYNVYYGTAAGVTKATGTKIAGATSPRIVSNLANMTAYYFVVTAENAGGESAESAERTATPIANPPPPAPTGVRATAGDNTVTVSWDVPGGPAGYAVYYRTSPGVTKANGTKIGGAISPWDVTGLTNGTTYYFVVTLEDANGESAESFEVSATPSAAPQPPAAPTGVAAAAGNGQATVSWSAVAGATSYNIYYGTAAGVTKLTGTKIAGATSPRIVTGLNNGTTYFFVVTAVNANGESAESSEASATPAAPGGAFSQADLTGTWDVVFLQAGSEAHWLRVVATINGSGAVTVTSALDSNGDTTVPPAGSITNTISATGVVTEGGVNGTPSFHGQMSSNKLLVIGPDNGTTGSSARLRVARKRTPTAFTPADLANKTFTFHSLRVGTDNDWSYGAGTTDGSGVATITSETTPSGPQTPGTGGTLSVDANGIVTISGEPFYGLMTDDKKVIFVIEGSGGNYAMIVITITGPVYVQSDLAYSPWNFVSLRNALDGVWGYGTYSMDAFGDATYLSYADSVGGPTPADFSRTLLPNGTIIDPFEGTYHGQLSYNKDIGVRTNTNAGGQFGLAISFK